MKMFTEYQDKLISYLTEDIYTTKKTFYWNNPYL